LGDAALAEERGGDVPPPPSPDPTCVRGIW